MMPAPSEPYVHELPGESIRLRYLGSDERPTPLDLADAALDALDALRPLVHPLAVELVVGCCDREYGYHLQQQLVAKPHWVLCKAALPSHVSVEPWMVDPVVAEADGLTRAELRAWIEAAQQQERPEGETYCWTTLRYLATRARLPEPERFADRAEMTLNASGDDLSIPLERDAEGAWISGPVPRLLSTEGPMNIRVSQDMFTLDLDIDVMWSLWTTPGTEGHSMLQSALDRLAERGWERAEEASSP